MAVFKIAEKISEFLAWITIKIVILLTGLMTLTVLVGVFFRYVLGNPLGWTEALARYTMIWAALLAVSPCIKDQEHVGLEIIVRKLPAKFAKIFNLITGLLIVFFLFEITRRGIDMAISGLGQRSLSLGITMFWPLMSVPVSSALALIQQILHMISTLDPDADTQDIFGETEVDQALDEAQDLQ